VQTAPAKRALQVAAALSAELTELSQFQPALPVQRSEQTRRADEAVAEAYDLLIDDPELLSTTQKLFRNGHWAQSVEKAFKYINNFVKHRTGLAADGADLMNRALSPKSPLLKLSALETESQCNQQIGYMQIMADAMTGVRNPRAHEHRYLEDPRVALELLCLANHLARIIGHATRARSRRTTSPH